MLALSIADVRDYVVIAFAGSGSLLFIFMLVASLVLFKKLLAIMNAAKGSAEATRVALGNAAATSSLLTEAVIKPIIKTSSFLIGVRQGIMFLGKLAKWGKK